MITFGTPIALWGLCLLPVIWWLFRDRNKQSDIFVPALFLWPKQASNYQHAQQHITHPWYLLTLILLLLLALSEPKITTHQQQVTLWIDTSPSLFTKEGELSRLEFGMKAAHQLVSTRDMRITHVIDLFQPEKSLPTNQRDSLAMLAPTFHSKPLPWPVYFQAQTHHWLITDGHHAKLNAWLKHAPIHQLIEVGRTKQNVGIQSMTGRMLIDNTEKMQISLTITNTGSVAQDRKLLVETTEEKLIHPMTLNPGQEKNVSLQTRYASRITARLTPQDALTIDDEMTISMPPPAAIQIDANCPAEIHRVISSHPGLKVFATGKPLVRLLCDHTLPTKIRQRLSEHATTTRIPIIWFQPKNDKTIKHVVDTLWFKHKHSYQPMHIKQLLTFSIQSGNTTITLADNFPIVTLIQTIPAVYKVSVDVTDPTFMHSNAFPNFFNRLLESMLSTPLLLPESTDQRTRENLTISPKKLNFSNQYMAAPSVVSYHNIAPWLLLAALLMLVYALLSRFLKLHDRLRMDRGFLLACTFLTAVILFLSFHHKIANKHLVLLVEQSNKVNLDDANRKAHQIIVQHRNDFDTFSLIRFAGKAQIEILNANPESRHLQKLLNTKQIPTKHFVYPQITALKLAWDKAISIINDKDDSKIALLSLPVNEKIISKFKNAAQHLDITFAQHNLLPTAAIHPSITAIAFPIKSNPGEVVCGVIELHSNNATKILFRAYVNNELILKHEMALKKDSHHYVPVVHSFKKIGKNNIKITIAATQSSRLFDNRSHIIDVNGPKPTLYVRRGTGTPAMADVIIKRQWPISVIAPKQLGQHLERLQDSVLILDDIAIPDVPNNIWHKVILNCHCSASMALAQYLLL